MTGSVTEVKGVPYQTYNGYSFYQIQITSSGGAVTGISPSPINGLIERIVIIPGAAGSQPDNNWDLYLQDQDMSASDFAATNFYANAAISNTLNTVARIAYGGQNGFPCRSGIQITAANMGAGAKTAVIKLYFKI